MSTTSVTEGSTVQYNDTDGTTHAAIVKQVHSTHSGLVALHVFSRSGPHHDVGTVAHSTDPKAPHTWHHLHEAVSG